MLEEKEDDVVRGAGCVMCTRSVVLFWLKTEGKKRKMMWCVVCGVCCDGSDVCDT